MKRRGFFQLLGTAILGTAISLKIPDSLIPTIEIPEIPEFIPYSSSHMSCTPLTYEALEAAYKKVMKESLEPQYIIYPMPKIKMYSYKL